MRGWIHGQALNYLGVWNGKFRLVGFGRSRHIIPRQINGICLWITDHWYTDNNVFLGTKVISSIEDKFMRDQKFIESTHYMTLLWSYLQNYVLEQVHHSRSPVFRLSPIFFQRSSQHQLLSRASTVSSDKASALPLLRHNITNTQYTKEGTNTYQSHLISICSTKKRPHGCLLNSNSTSYLSNG